MTNKGHCRVCNHALSTTFADLGVSPLANSYLPAERLSRMEPFYPLHVYVCSNCLLVQLEEFESPEAIFSDYAYFSSFSSSWLDHAREYAEQVTQRYELGPDSLVIEVASNDGYLLQYFHRKGVPVLGIEPAANVAKVAVERGIPTRTMFFGTDTGRALAEEGLRADLLAGNNVYAHVPDLHSFTEGLRIVLKPRGVITLEFPHVAQMMRFNQFDTIYHEHFSYLSLLVVENVFKKHGLTVFDVDELPTHGGSLRIYGKHEDDESKPVSDSVCRVRKMELEEGLHDLQTYRAFAAKVREVKYALLEFLVRCQRQGKSVAGYGAPAKGNTLLNYCGVGPELLPYTVDRSPHKQGQYLPGTRIPIERPDVVLERRPDYVLILPWNLQEEISAQMSQIRDWGGRFVVPIPSLTVLA
jgi:2-polyprenyl-3-methyl-5-hydroxy-6-metoxy-1,4-benzoquinol methylase